MSPFDVTLSILQHRSDTSPAVGMLRTGNVGSTAADDQVVVTKL